MIATAGTPDESPFLAASADGSAVLLRDGRLHYLTGEEPTVDLTEGQGGFQGILGDSEDLSSIYFLDTAALPAVAGEQNEAGEEAEAGVDNLYAWRQGSPTRFIARLRSTDDSGLGSGGGLTDWSSVPAFRTAEASPDGRYLAFASRAELAPPIAGYSNVGPCEENLGKFIQTPCPEVYLYDSQTGRLSCPSCNPSGAAPLGWSVLRRFELAPRSASQPRYLTDSGRLYFDSEESLLPADTNEGVEDVYQWEPEGVGSCQREAGCTSLLSAGTGTGDSNFLAIDAGDGEVAAGADVFFTTRDRLTQRDTDELLDLYDAREGGGLASETEVARSECQGEACQAQVTAPNDPTPGSSSFEGAGNVVEEKPSPRCAKGKVHSKGRCVAKKHHKRSHHRAANQNRRAHR